MRHRVRSSYQESQKRRAAKYNKPYTAYCEKCNRSREFMSSKKCSTCKTIDPNHQ